jgi:hypothetical protein
MSYIFHYHHLFRHQTFQEDIFKINVKDVRIWTYVFCR